MTLAPLDFDEQHSSIPFPPSPTFYFPVAQLAGELHVSEATLLRLIWNKKVACRERKHGKGYEINILTLPAEYRAAAMAAHPEVFADDLPPVGQTPLDRISRYLKARASVQARAEKRLFLVRSLNRAREERLPSETLAHAESRWFHLMQRRALGIRFSIRSVKDWSAAYAKHGLNGLVDGNDGEAQSGSRIAAPAKELFEFKFFRAHKPNLTLAYEQTRKGAELYGWGPMPCRRTFARYADSFSNMYWQLKRDNADTPREVMPYIRRDPTSVPVYHTLQGDSRQLDVPVQCPDPACRTCKPSAERPGRNAKRRKTPAGHYPVWSIWIDTHSRRIVDWELTIEAPTSWNVLASTRRMIAAHGLMRNLIIDNGTPYIKALGRPPKTQRIARSRDEVAEAKIDARFEILGVDVSRTETYSPQSKGVVESVFRTFRFRFDERFDCFRRRKKAAVDPAHQGEPLTLPTLSDLAYQLQLAVDEYHHETHSGFRMNGRTPHQVWSDESLRLPRIAPDPKAFALVYFEPVTTPARGRMVGQLGVRVGKEMYRLAELDKQFRYYGERVDVRINPDDVREAILLDWRTGAYICEARLDDEYASYEKGDPLTSKLIARKVRDCHELMKMAERTYDPETQTRLEQHARQVVAYYERLREARGGETTRGVVSIRPDVTTQAAPRPAVVVAPPKQASNRSHRNSARKASRRLRHAGALSWAAVAKALRISPMTLLRYRNGRTPWPEGMKEQFDTLAAYRNSPDVPAVVVAPITTARRYGSGSASWTGIARTLGISEGTLLRYRNGKSKWPEGMEERFRQLVAQRETGADKRRNGARD